MKTDDLTIVGRAVAPTPKFFKKLRKIGLVMAAVGATVLASPIAVPVLVVELAGYLTLAGSVLTAVSQTAVDEEALRQKHGDIQQAQEEALEKVEKQVAKGKGRRAKGEGRRGKCLMFRAKGLVLREKGCRKWQPFLFRRRKGTGGPGMGSFARRGATGVHLR